MFTNYGAPSLIIMESILLFALENGGDVAQAFRPATAGLKPCATKCKLLHAPGNKAVTLGVKAGRILSSAEFLEALRENI